ncbi:PTS sugar transporter subunit IIA [Alkalihalobacillus sp. MEB130]|uniref:PTS sugar transporter subunit IIA n=1 Tax=Alkalihalobacillus sp. MEB130 TaxID=2976704 RepID=UPI0028DE84DA|nr:PTS sugar transporter subunit IIA [Alkalihalobacillus sp. MEB130]MDT8861807.1 PTS sugar transporter subunit IIA [Alkalihalobacillus sp. MEB130]
MVINRKLVCLDLKAKDKLEAINELGELAYSIGRVKSKDKYIEAVMKRESDFSTAVGYSIAIPHGKSNEVIEPFVAFGRLNEGIVWEGPEAQEVRLVFLIGVPEHHSGNVHLQVLANISRNLMDANFRNQLLTAGSIDEVSSALQAVEIQ